MKYLKQFETQSAYDAAKDGLVLPNVSLINADGHVEYEPYVEPVETRVVAKFNITDTSNPTMIACSTSAFTAIEIDGVEQSSLVTAYTFDTVGEHTVKYTLKDPTKMDQNQLNRSYMGPPTGISAVSIIVPDTVVNIGSMAFYGYTSLTSLTFKSVTPPVCECYGSFGNSNNCPIYVPSESVDAYKAATYWNDFASRIQAIQ